MNYGEWLKLSFWSRLKLLLKAAKYCGEVRIEWAPSWADTGIHRAQMYNAFVIGPFAIVFYMYKRGACGACNGTGKCDCNGTGECGYCDGRGNCNVCEGEGR